jgi:hypothetical protein
MQVEAEDLKDREHPVELHGRLPALEFDDEAQPHACRGGQLGLAKAHGAPRVTHGLADVVW